MEPQTRQIQTRQSADAAFQLLSDPAAWRLFDAQVEHLSQRPVAPGTQWSYRGREYVCVDLTAPVRFAISTGGIVIEHDITPAHGGATIAIRTPREQTPDAAKLLDEHFELLVRPAVAGKHSLRMILRYPGAARDAEYVWQIRVRSKLLAMAQAAGVVLGVILAAAGVVKLFL